MLITNFASGELSPTLNGRIDLNQYYQGCSKLKNFEIIPTGGIKRRVGTKKLIDLDEEYRLIPFIRDVNNNFVIMIKTDEIAIYKYYIDGTLSTNPQVISLVAQVNKTDENIIKFDNFETVKEIQYAQDYNKIVLVHRSHTPIILKVNSAGDIDASEMNFDFAPDVEVDDDYGFIMLCKSNYPTYIESSLGLKFTYMDIDGTTREKQYESDVQAAYCILGGKLYVYTTTSNNWDAAGLNTEIDDTLFTTTGNYPGSVAFWNNRLYFGSSYTHIQRVWASATPDTQRERFNDFTPYIRYVTVNKVVKDPNLHPFSCDILTAEIDISNNQTTLRNVSQDFTQIEDITKYYVSGNYIPYGTKVKSVTANTIIIDTANISIEESKMNEAMSIQLWVSAQSTSANDYEYQVTSTENITADCSFFFDLASSENDAIMFFSPGSTMTIGTESSVWSLSPESSALNISVRMQGRYGSDNIQGFNVGEACIYLAQGKKGIREFYYNSANEAFQTNNIALLAQHLMTESPVIDFDYITNPYNRLMLAREDGTVAALLYDKNNGIMGWNRITLGDGQVRSVAVIRGYDQYDITLFLVQHGDVYTVEVYDPGQEVYLDCWKQYEEDDEYNYQSTYVKKTINGVVYIGYKFESDIISLPVVNGNEKKRIVSLSVRFLQSYMPVMKCTGIADEKFTGLTVPFSGVKKITYPGASDTDVTFELITDDIYPVNILSVDAIVV